VASAAAVAVIVTLAPDGMAEGAVYTIAPASSLGLKTPHAFALAQMTE